MRKHIILTKFLCFSGAVVVSAAVQELGWNQSPLSLIGIAQAEQASGVDGASFDESLPGGIEADDLVPTGSRGNTRSYRVENPASEHDGDEVEISERDDGGRTITVTDRGLGRSSRTETYIWRDGQLRTYMDEHVSSTNPDTGSRSTSFHRRDYGEDRQPVQVWETFEEDDGARWSRFKERGPDGNLPDSWGPKNDGWVPENDLATEQQATDPVFGDAGAELPPVDLPDVWPPLPENEDNETEPDQNGDGTPDLPSPEQLTGRTGAPSTCGEITDPDVAVAMGCSPVGAGAQTGTPSSASYPLNGSGAATNTFAPPTYTLQGSGAVLDCSQDPGTASALPESECALLDARRAAAQQEYLDQFIQDRNLEGGAAVSTGAPSACGQITDPNEAAAMGCTSEPAGAGIPPRSPSCGEITEPAVALAMGCTASDGPGASAGSGPIIRIPQEGGGVTVYEGLPDGTFAPLPQNSPTGGYGPPNQTIPAGNVNLPHGGQVP